jgi:dual specificity phosphatase 12
MSSTTDACGDDGASEVLPYLFLGTIEDAQNDRFIKRKNVKVIINVSGVGYWLSDPSVVVHRFDLPDRSEAEILPIIAKAIPILNAARDRWSRFGTAERDVDAATADGESSRAPPTCLVHCQKGISRSASVIAGYLVEQNGWGTDETIRFLQQRRPRVDPNMGFRSQLELLEHGLIEKQGSERQVRRQRLALLLRNLNLRTDDDIAFDLSPFGSVLRMERKDTLVLLYFACRAVRRRVQQAIVGDSSLREHLSGSSDTPAQIVTLPQS